MAVRQSGGRYASSAFWGRSNFKLTRRGFLGGSIAAPVTSKALGQQPPEFDEIDLLFTLSDDQRHLTIGIIELDYGSPDAGPRIGPQLVWDAKKFGPDARFVLRDLSSRRQKLYHVRIERGSYGRLTNRTLRFEFHQAPVRALVSNGIRRPLRFGITAYSALFSRSAQVLTPLPFDLEDREDRPFPSRRTGRRRAPDPGLLREFISGGTILSQQISDTIATSTFRLLFNGLLRLGDSLGREVPQDGLSNGRVLMAFDRTQQWTIRPAAFPPDRRLFAIDPSIRIAELLMGWSSERELGVSQDDSLKLLAYGNAEIEDGSLTFRAGDGPDIRLDPMAQKNRHVVFRTSTADLDANQGLVRAEVSIPLRSALTIDGDVRTAFGKVGNLVGRLLERVDAPIRADARDYRRRAGSLSFDADFEDTGAQRVNSPIGPIVLRGHNREGPLASLADPRPSLPNAFDEPFAPRWGQQVTVNWSWQSDRRDTMAVDWIEINAALMELGSSLEGTSFSRLTLEPSDIQVFWRSENFNYPTQSSLLRLGAPRGSTMARVDLARARLKASRHDDLLSLSFRFRDLWLVYRDGPPQLMQGTPTCFLGPAFDLDRDPRPVLVVEFPGQHLFEEALFLPRPAPVPDAVVLPEETEVGVDQSAIVPTQFALIAKRADGVTMDDTTADAPLAIEVTRETVRFDPNDPLQVIEALSTLSGREARTALRTLLRDRKSLVSGQFAEFAKEYREKASILARKTLLPADQLVYIGGFGMDADAFAMARLVWDEMTKKKADDLFQTMFARLQDARITILNAAATLRSIEDERLLDHDRTIEGALLLEARLEAEVPAYQLFRTFYREIMLGFATSDTRGLATVDLASSHHPKELEPAQIEFFLAGALSTSGAIFSGSPATGTLNARFTAVKTAFVQVALNPKAADVINQSASHGLLEARLASPSRLAFHVPCPDGVQHARIEQRHLDQPNDAEEDLPRPSFRFHIDDLTNFSNFELSVTARAEKLYSASETGRIDVRSRRRENIGPGAMLDRLGFQSGLFVTSSMRLADIQTSLAQPPGDYETSIELPSRLVLSPNQEAVIIGRNRWTPPDRLFDDTPVPFPSAVPLWSAEFQIEDIDPGIRAVHSPDLRPDFVWQRIHRSTGPGGGRAPGGGAPPRGPFSPWFIGAVTASSELPDPRELSKNYDRYEDVAEALAKHEGKDEFCAEVVRRSSGTESRLNLPLVIDQICRKFSVRAPGDPAPQLKFRGPTDAFMRHELVLLSSAWGLPVVGRRTPQGQLSPLSSQAEPERRHQLVDIGPGSALYQPRTLRVSELSLTTLGGSLRHDTSFEPPAAAKYLNNQSLFDALSIERWQQWTNLGRDIFCEVVFKGFLFPLGHRASLVQLTERTFLRDGNGAIRAYLRQRMFIRVGKPLKRFPAILQPFAGRQFPVENLNLLTVETPDIVDPANSKPAAGKLNAEGRLGLGDAPGLVFWPRTAPLQEANVRFEMELDESTSDLPLLFVDNVAANDIEALDRIVKYYNGQPSPDQPSEMQPVDPIRHVRTVVFKGEKRRYAAETRAGSASVETDHWTLMATGRWTADGGFAGKASDTSVRLRTQVLNDFNFDPILQGADQPPFYPAIEVARIQPRQAERLMSRALPPIRAMFDFRYLNIGFPELPDGQHLDGNASEVYLAFADPDQHALGMGEKGDQSGGVMRFAGHALGFARSRGLLTATQKVDIPLGGGYPILSERFDQVLLTAPAPNSSIEGSTTTSSSPEPTAIADAIKRVRKIYADLFSDDAKILGLVSLREIMEFVDEAGLEDPASGMPELGETIRYGAGELGTAVNDAADEAADTVDFVRLRIVAPLSETVTDIREDWNEIERQLAEKQGAILPGVNAGGNDFIPINSVTIAEIFPELDGGLRALDNALTKTAAITDRVEFALALGEVYEAGRRFVDALTRTLSNPVERVETAFRSRFDAAKDMFGALEEGLPAIVQELGHAFIGDQVDQLVNRLVPSGSRPPEIHLLRLPRVDGLAISEAAAARIDDALAKLYLTRDEMRGVLKSLILFTVQSYDSEQGNEPEDFLGSDVFSDVFTTDERLRFTAALVPPHAEQILSRFRQRAVAAEAELTSILRAEIAAAQADARTELGKLEDELLAYLATVLADAEETALAFLRGEMAEELAFVLRLHKRYMAFRAALDTSNVKVLLEETVKTVEVFAGPLGISAEAVCNKVNVVFKPLTVIVDTLNLDQLALCRNIKLSRPVEVLNGELVNPDELAGIAEDTTCGEIFRLNQQINETLAALPSQAEILAKFNAVTDKLTGDLTTRAEGLRDVIVNDLGDVRNQLRVLRSATATAFATLVNDTRAAATLDRALKDAATIDVCAIEINSPDPLGDVADMPRMLSTFATRREQALETLRTAANTVGQALTALARNNSLLAAAASALLPSGILIAVENATSGAADDMKALVADLRSTLDDLAQQEHLLANRAAGCLLRVVTPVQRLSDQLVTAAEELQSLVNQAKPIVDLSGVKENLDQIRKIEEYLADLQASLEALRTNPAANLNQLNAMVSHGPSPLAFVTLNAAPGSETLATLRAKQAEVERAMQEIEKAARNLMERVGREVLAQLDEPVAKALKVSLPVPFGDATTVANLYATLLDRRNDVIARAPPFLKDMTRKAILVLPGEHRKSLGAAYEPATGEGDLTPASDRLAGDVAWLAHAARNGAQPVSDVDTRMFLATFLAEWGEGTSTPMTIGQQLFEIISHLLKGDLLKIIDLNAIRDAVEDYLLDLIPSEIAMRYGYGVKLGSDVAKATQGVFVPGPTTRLNVQMQVAISLSQGEPDITYRSTGELGPFDVKLVGDIFDALTLKFRGASFTARDGEAPKFTIDYDSHVIGPELEFVQQLQSIMSPKDGSGAFVLPRFDMPGIEAGYKLALGTFSIGAVSFFNIALNTAAILPFSSAPARFSVGLSSRNNPFTISYLPYGGSGYFSIEADAKGIQQFEASFEFGGAGAFGFGALTGEGRLMSGIYIKQTTLDGGRKITEISGTFFVGGNARIWIFSFGASLYVRLGMVTGGAMSGEAVFTYSFSIGIKDFEFSVTVWKQEGKGFSGAPQSWLGRGPTQFAQFGAPSAMPDLPDGAPVVATDVYCAKDNFSRHMAYFEQPFNVDDFFR